ncbi:LysR family transcriptional regulator ArgP [Paraferrimonas sedimenticola]|uniref:Transcriptional regulator ArgP n=1 Tax=Paraferrimonas sedimenticola TaxID=375674 RepID=A0AA37VSN4_9GAMM|nr:LysR family transcriptional regulator ArgP [Paraferrimonas sedimenticola]GLP94766.1 transcriptional regulator ArgP [Paraferrimonas sedimenticola]
MLDYKGLQALATVVQEGGFERAAKVLFISQSAVSQRVKQLEQKTGEALLIRSNPVETTAAGNRLLRHFQQVSLLEAELGHERGEEVALAQSKIQIAVNADSLATWFMPSLNALFDRRDWLLDLIIDDEGETHKLLKDGKVIGCVTTEAHALPGCRSDYLGTMIYSCVCNRSFKARYFADGMTPAALQKAPGVVFSVKDEMHHRYLQQHHNMAPGQWQYHRIPSSESFLELIVNGFGYGLVSHLQAKPLIEQQRLIELEPDKQMKVPLYWQHWNIKAPQTTLIYRALSATARRYLLQEPTP